MPLPVSWSDCNLCPLLFIAFMNNLIKARLYLLHSRGLTSSQAEVGVGFKDRLLAEGLSWETRIIGVRHGVFKRVEDGRRSPSL
jgi:hypothetical protein